MNRKYLIRLDYVRYPLFFFIIFCMLDLSLYADWPQYRNDAARSGYSNETLDKELSLSWVRKTDRKPHRAWVGRSLARSRMKFDWIYSPVISDGKLYFGSSADHKIYCLDAVDGKEIWTFFTEGPVRLAPAVHGGHVYVGSDDGYLYCMDKNNGALKWKFRAGPTDEKIIGNSRMVSRWMIRSGIAIQNGIVYFGAGIWPLEGVYIYALKADDGKVLWCNDYSGNLRIDQPHLNCFAQGGVCAQGYLAVGESHLMVATGRSVPAVYDLKTGELQYYHLGRYGGKSPAWGTGGGDVVTGHGVFFNSGLIFDVETGLRFNKVGRFEWWRPYIKNGQEYHGEYLVGDRQHYAVLPDAFFRSDEPLLRTQAD